MRLLSRSLPTVVAAASLALAMLTSAVAVCPEMRMVTATEAAPHDCEGPESGAPTAPATDPHQACQMLTPCVSIAFAGASLPLATLDAPDHPQPSARDDRPPAAIARAPVAPPPRA